MKNHRTTARHQAPAAPFIVGVLGCCCWAATLLYAGEEARELSTKGSVNAELLELYEQDQADRSAANYDEIDWSEVGPRDRERRKRVREIVVAGDVHVADDYFHAAMVFQHGEQPEDFKQAHEWAVRAVELDPDHDSAKWLAAATEDRYLMNTGKPQKYGTQFRRDKDGPWYLYEVDPSVTDEQRKEWNVPPLSEALARVDEMNAKSRQSEIPSEQ